MVSTNRLKLYLHSFCDKLENIGADTDKNEQNLRQLIARHPSCFGQHPPAENDNEQNKLVKDINPVAISLKKGNFVRNLKS